MGSMALADNLPFGLASFFSLLAWHMLLLGSHYIPHLCQEPGFSSTHLWPQPVPGELMWSQAGAPDWMRTARSKAFHPVPSVSQPLFLLAFHHMQVCGFIRGPREGAMSVGNTTFSARLGSPSPFRERRVL